MKVVRVLKWIAFVVFILAFALSAVANSLVFSDVVRVTKADKTSSTPLLQHILLNESDDLLMGYIQKELAALPFGIDNLRSPTEAYSISYEAPTKPVDEVVPEVVDEEPVSEPEVPVEEPTDPEDVEWPVSNEEDEPLTGSSGSVSYNEAYDVKDHGNLVFGVMKYGSATFAKDSFLNKLGFENVEFNISFFIAMCALVLAFLFHVISKRHKTVYGTILMIVGFLFFCAFVALSVFVNEAVIDLLSVSETTDCARYGYLITVMLTALGILIGLPIYSCGVRQITCKRLRKRLSRRSR